MIAPATVDSALDSVGLDDDGEEQSPAHALADLLDHTGQWDWTDGAEHEPSDRIGILESSGAWWLVYRGTEGDQCWRYDACDPATRHLVTLAADIVGES